MHSRSWCSLPASTSEATLQRTARSSRPRRPLRHPSPMAMPTAMGTPRERAGTGGSSKRERRLSPSRLPQQHACLVTVTRSLSSFLICGPGYPPSSPSPLPLRAPFSLFLSLSLTRCFCALFTHFALHAPLPFIVIYMLHTHPLYKQMLFVTLSLLMMKMPRTLLRRPAFRSSRQPRTQSSAGP